MLAGNLLDILRASAPIIMIALGMSLVIATGRHRPLGRLDDGRRRRRRDGVPLEAATASTPIGACSTAIGLALALAIVLGAINGLLVAVVGLQPFITTLS